MKPWETSDEGRQLILAVLAGLGKGLKDQWATLFDAEQLAKVRSEALAAAASTNVAKEHRLDALEILAGLAGDTSEVDAAALKIVKTDADGELRTKALRAGRLATHAGNNRRVVVAPGQANARRSRTNLRRPLEPP
ncbi:MAG: hypothetical protein QM775_16265 [Pirellulales bacterium]